MQSSELTSLLSNGAATARPFGRSTGPAQLGQEDFLQLMTAQLRNQDPFSPMQNGEFIAQMAQFSTVSGLQSANATLESINAGFLDQRMTQAASLVGRWAMVPGETTRPNAQGEVHGAVTLSEPVEAMRVTYTDARTGAILHRQDLGPQEAGQVGFSWDGAAPNGEAVRVEVSAQSATGTSPATVSVFARILAAHLGQGVSGVILDVEGHGQVDQIEISSYR